jgi:hypothetical protein
MRVVKFFSKIKAVIFSVASEDGKTCFYQFFGTSDDSGPERDVDYRVLFGPVPVVFEVKSFEKLLFPEKGLAQGIQEKRFAKTPRTGKKIVFTGIYEFSDKRRLVYIVIT